MDDRQTGSSSDSDSDSSSASQKSESSWCSAGAGGGGASQRRPRFSVTSFDTGLKLRITSRPREPSHSSDRTCSKCSSSSEDDLPLRQVTERRRSAACAPASTAPAPAPTAPAPAPAATAPAAHPAPPCAQESPSCSSSSCSSDSDDEPQLPHRQTACAGGGGGGRQDVGAAAGEATGAVVAGAAVGAEDSSSEMELVRAAVQRAAADTSDSEPEPAARHYACSLLQRFERQTQLLSTAAPPAAPPAPRRRGRPRKRAAGSPDSGINSPRSPPRAQPSPPREPPRRIDVAALDRMLYATDRVLYPPRRRPDERARRSVLAELYVKRKDVHARLAALASGPALDPAWRQIDLHSKYSDLVSGYRSDHDPKPYRSCSRLMESGYRSDYGARSASGYRTDRSGYRTDHPRRPRRPARRTRSARDRLYYRHKHFVSDHDIAQLASATLACLTLAGAGPDSPPPPPPPPAPAPRRPAPLPLRSLDPFAPAPVFAASSPASTAPPAPPPLPAVAPVSKFAFTHKFGCRPVPVAADGSSSAQKIVSVNNNVLKQLSQNVSPKNNNKNIKNANSDPDPVKTFTAIFDKAKNSYVPNKMLCQNMFLHARRRSRATRTHYKRQRCRVVLAPPKMKLASGRSPRPPAPALFHPAPAPAPRRHRSRSRHRRRSRSLSRPPPAPAACDLDDLLVDFGERCRLASPAPPAPPPEPALAAPAKPLKRTKKRKAAEGADGGGAKRRHKKQSGERDAAPPSTNEHKLPLKKRHYHADSAPAAPPAPSAPSPGPVQVKVDPDLPPPAVVTPKKRHRLHAPPAASALDLVVESLTRKLAADQPPAPTASLAAPASAPLSAGPAHKSEIMTRKKNRLEGLTGNLISKMNPSAATKVLDTLLNNNIKKSIESRAPERREQLTVVVDAALPTGVFEPSLDLELHIPKTSISLSCVGGEVGDAVAAAPATLAALAAPAAPKARGKLKAGEVKTLKQNEEKAEVPDATDASPATEAREVRARRSASVLSAVSDKVVERARLDRRPPPAERAAGDERGRRAEPAERRLETPVRRLKRRKAINRTGFPNVRKKKKKAAEPCDRVPREGEAAANFLLRVASDAAAGHSAPRLSVISLERLRGVADAATAAAAGAGAATADRWSEADEDIPLSELHQPRARVRRRSARRAPAPAPAAPYPPPPPAADLSDAEPLPLDEREGPAPATPAEPPAAAPAPHPRRNPRLRKTFLVAGLFSDYYKREAGAGAGAGPGEAAPPLLPPPAYCERWVRRRLQPFTLPYDIWWQLKHSHAVPSWNYRKIRSNVYQEARPPAEECEAVACNCAPESGCPEDCINRLVYAECAPQLCPCGERCRNQRIQRHDWAPGLERFMTASKGWGVRCATRLLCGEFILEYVGEVVSDKEFKERMASRYARDTHHYCLHLDGALVIDGHRAGGEGRFVNHSCRPNCEMQKWTANGTFRMALFALRDVAPGEELTYDYNFSLFNPAEGQVCKCGAEECRGVIGGKSQRVGRAATATGAGVAGAAPASARQRAGRPRKPTKCSRKTVGRGELLEVCGAPAERQLTARERTLVRDRHCFLVRALRRGTRPLRPAPTAPRPPPNPHVSLTRLPADVPRVCAPALPAAPPASPAPPAPAAPSARAAQEDVIRCVCGLHAEEGLMVQCGRAACGVWQHARCMRVTDTAAPHRCHVCSPRRVDPEVPLDDATEDGHPFYLTLLRGELQVRQGDTVYVLRDIAVDEAHPDRSGDRAPRRRPPRAPPRKHTYRTIGDIPVSELDIFRVERLWKHKDTGERFVYGHHYLRPHETYHEPTRKFFHNEVMRVPLYEAVSIDLVMSQCWVMDLNTYCKGRPVGAREEHVYICELRVDRSARLFSKVSRHKHPICTKTFAFTHFPQRLKISRTYAPHEVSPEYLKGRGGGARGRPAGPARGAGAAGAGGAARSRDHQRERLGAIVSRLAAAAAARRLSLA